LRMFLGNIIAFYVTAMLLNDPSLPAEMRNVQLSDFMDIFMHGILQKEPDSLLNLSPEKTL